MPSPKLKWRVVLRITSSLNLRPSPPLVIGTNDLLVVVHDGTSHQAGLLREEEHHRAGGLLRVDQTSKRTGRAGFFEPVVGGTVESALGFVLTRGRHPSGIQAIHPYPVR